MKIRKNIHEFSFELQLNSRVRNTVEQKKRLVSALKANVSEEAQNLFIWLGKMLPSDEGSNGFIEKTKIINLTKIL